MTQQTAVGVREKVEIQGDWHAFFVNTGSQYPLKLSTKKPTLVAQAMQFRADELVEWVYTEKESDKINEKSGKPFVNRWLEEVHLATAESAERESAAGAPPSPSPASQSASTPASRPADTRSASIERQVVIKAAFPAYVEKFVNTPSDFWKACDTAAAWIANSPPSPEQVQAQAPAGSHFVDSDEIPF